MAPSPKHNKRKFPKTRGLVFSMKELECSLHCCIDEHLPIDPDEWDRVYRDRMWEEQRIAQHSIGKMIGREPCSSLTSERSVSAKFPIMEAKEINGSAGFLAIVTFVLKMVAS